MTSGTSLREWSGPTREFWHACARTTPVRRQPTSESSGTGHLSVATALWALTTGSQVQYRTGDARLWDRDPMDLRAGHGSCPMAGVRHSGVTHQDWSGTLHGGYLRGVPWPGQGVATQ